MRIAFKTNYYQALFFMSRIIMTQNNKKLFYSEKNITINSIGHAAFLL